jgi:hypothetical protein
LIYKNRRKKEMTTATLKAFGKLITDIMDTDYNRYALTDDGRIFREGTVGRSSKYVWIAEDGKTYYKDLFAAYYDENRKTI